MLGSKNVWVNKFLVSNIFGFKNFRGSKNFEFQIFRGLNCVVNKYWGQKFSRVKKFSGVTISWGSTIVVSQKFSGVKHI